MKDIAEERGCGHSTIHYSLKKHHIPIREKYEKMVEALYQRPAYFFTNPKGYEQVAAGVAVDVNYVRIHRLVAIAEFGIEAVLGQESIVRTIFHGTTARES